MAAPSPLHVVVVDWNIDEGPVPTLWVGTNLDYVARASAQAMWADAREVYPVMVQLGDPARLSHQNLLDWHRALHELDAVPVCTFYYASVEGGEAMPVSGWLAGEEPDE